VRKLIAFVQVEPRLDALAQHPKLIAVLQTLIVEPVRMFQDMALLKPPKLGREKPWHQDHAYFKYSIETKVVGVWITLDAANVDNACMRILPGLHRGRPFIHFKRRDWQICDKEIEALPHRHCVAVPLKPGGCLFFSSFLPHGTPVNDSSQRRWAVQFHYRPASAESVSDEQRLAVFGSGGKGVEC